MNLAPNLRGAIWMVIAAAGFTVMTVLIKFLGDDYSAAVQTFYRSIASFLVLLPFIVRNPKGAFRTTRPGVMLFRAAVGTTAMIMAFYAFQKLPLADANALSFTRTLWLVPLAYFVLKEPVGPARVGAALVGFSGILLMTGVLTEGVAAFSMAHVAALAAAFLFSLTVTGLKTITPDHSPLQILVWSASLGLVFSIPPAAFTWRWPTFPDFLLLSLMGIIGIFTQYCYTRGMKVGDAAAMAPLDYIRLVFAAIAGFLLFGQVPTVAAWIGAGIVVGSTLFIAWREQVVARRKPEHPLE